MSQALALAEKGMRKCSGSVRISLAGVGIGSRREKALLRKSSKDGYAVASRMLIPYLRISPSAVTRDMCSTTDCAMRIRS